MLRLRPEIARLCMRSDGRRSTAWNDVCSLNRKARLLGLVPCMTKVEVETFEQITILRRAITEEAAAEMLCSYVQVVFLRAWKSAAQMACFYA